MYMNRTYSSKVGFALMSGSDGHYIYDNHLSDNVYILPDLSVQRATVHLHFDSCLHAPNTTDHCFSALPTVTWAAFTV